jgi:hypothetical protein
MVGDEADVLIVSQFIRASGQWGQGSVGQGEGEVEGEEYGQSNVLGWRMGDVRWGM